MAEKRFSELTAAGTLTGAEILAMSQTTMGTLLSVRNTLQAIANWIAVNSNYTSALDTTDKTLCGAINELKQLISLIPQFSIEVVNTLPVSDISETTIYLVPNSDPEQGNYYEEYIYVNNAWELVGTTEVDLSAYYTKLEVDGLLSAKANTSDVTAALALKEAKSDLDDDVTDIVVGLTDTQTATGNPVTLTTEQEGGAKSALVTFAPKQSGTGDPSPSNIRPISGWDGLVLGQAGSKNIFGPNTTTQSAYIKSDGSVQSNNDFTVSDYIKVTPNTVLTFSPNSLGGNSAYNAYYDENKTLISTFLTGASNNKWTFTTPSNCAYMRFSYRNISTNIQLEFGDTATAYAPFISEATTNTATFADTVYGGTLDFVSGKGSNEWGHIASYNGETLPGEWISDRDVYAPNTSPTTGAEVAYKLATPTEITLTPEDIELLKGSNTIWSDANGNVTVEYAKLPNGNLGAVVDYIKKLEARIAALES